MTLLSSLPSNRGYILFLSYKTCNWSGEDGILKECLRPLTLPGLQDTAILVSVCAMVFNLSIAVHKLRAFHYCGLSAPPEDQEALIIYSAGWTPYTALIRTSGTFKSLGVEYPVNQADSTSLHLI